MRVLSRYILGDFAATFALVLTVFTFVMFVVAFMHAIDLLAQGLSIGVILQIIALNLPFLMSSTIPVSALVSSLLVFGRLSVDGEITALRASGLSLWQICAPVLLFAAILTLFSLWLNFFAGPESRFARRKAKVDLADLNPLDLLEEGNFNYDLPGIQIYAGQIRQRSEEDFAQVKDVILNETSDKGVRRVVRAKRGTIEVDKSNLRLQIELQDVVIEDRDPADPNKVTILDNEVYTFNPSYQELMETRNISKGVKDLRFGELLSAIRDPGSIFKKDQNWNPARLKMKSMLEFHSRVATGVSCFSFALLGIPLGLRNRRKDSSFGILVSLVIMLVYYLFMTLSEALESHPGLFPDLIMWVPLLGCQIFGFYLLRKAA